MISKMVWKNKSIKCKSKEGAAGFQFDHQEGGVAGLRLFKDALPDSIRTRAKMNGEKNQETGGEILKAPKLIWSNF